MGSLKVNYRDGKPEIQQPDVKASFGREKEVA
jgi:hypothetical protein